MFASIIGEECGLAAYNCDAEESWGGKPALEKQSGVQFDSLR
jgi:hypothetical protein